MVDGSTAPAWFWFAGYDGDVECGGLYALGGFATCHEAIAAGRAEMPDIDGNTFFHIVEAQYGDDHDGKAEFVPFCAVRNAMTIHIGEGSDHG